MSGIRKYLTAREIEQKKIFEDEDWDLHYEEEDDEDDSLIFEKIPRRNYGKEKS